MLRWECWTTCTSTGIKLSSYYNVTSSLAPKEGRPLAPLPLLRDERHMTLSTLQTRPLASQYPEPTATISPKSPINTKHLPAVAPFTAQRPSVFLSRPQLLMLAGRHHSSHSPSASTPIPHPWRQGSATVHCSKGTKGSSVV